MILDKNPFDNLIISPATMAIMNHANLLTMKLRKRMIIELEKNVLDFLLIFCLGTQIFFSFKIFCFRL